MSTRIFRLVWQSCFSRAVRKTEFPGKLLIPFCLPRMSLNGDGKTQRRDPRLICPDPGDDQSVYADFDAEVSAIRRGVERIEDGLPPGNTFLHVNDALVT